MAPAWPLCAAAGAAGPDVHLAAGVGDFQRSEDGLAVLFGGEVVVEGSAVDFDFAGAGGDADAGDGGLAPADAPDVGRLELGAGGSVAGAGAGVGVVAGGSAGAAAGIAGVSAAIFRWLASGVFVRS